MATDLSKESQHDDEVDSQTISLLDTGERFMPRLREYYSRDEVRVIHPIATVPPHQRLNPLF
jgi:hypothetical protein